MTATGGEGRGVITDLRGVARIDLGGGGKKGEGRATPSPPPPTVSTWPGVEASRSVLRASSNFSG